MTNQTTSVPDDGHEAGVGSGGRTVPRAKPRLLAVSNGHPRSLATFSGTSANVLSHLDRSVDVDTMDVAPDRPTYVAAALATFRPNIGSWRSRYRIGRPFARSMGRRAAELAGRLDTSPDVVLQFGSWFDLSDIERFDAGIRCAYLDTNFASFARRVDVDVGPDSGLSEWRMRFERRIYDRLDVIFTFSEWTRASMINDFGQDPGKVIAVGAGSNVTTEVMEPAPDAEPRFLFVGKRFTRKGGQELLKAFELVRAAVPEAELWVVGPKKRPFPEQEGVVFRGFLNPSIDEERELLLSLYRRATAFVMPSRFEPFGIVFVEAMAHGLPCIATNQCAMPEIVDHGRTGYLVPPGDVGALGEAMIELAADRDGALAMGLAGQDRARNEYSWSAVARRLLAEIEPRC